MNLFSRQAVLALKTEEELNKTSDTKPTLTDEVNN